MNIEKEFASRFKCPKCRRIGGTVKKLAMTGTGLSKIFDIQMNKYLFVSCNSWGYTEVYNQSIIEGKEGMSASDILDLLFG
jgi:hypothetical protein